jgi:hypothetical protein
MVCWYILIIVIHYCFESQRYQGTYNSKAIKRSHWRNMADIQKRQTCFSPI